MEPLKPARAVELTPEEREQRIAGAMKVFPNISRAEVERELDRAAADELWKNDTYQVAVRREEVDGGQLIHLSIKRLDRGPARDWRDFQAIKNQIVGEEFEAVELYPAESRVVDTANQFHLWAVAVPGFVFPIGFPAGMRVDHDPEGEAETNTKQRKL